MSSKHLLQAAYVMQEGEGEGCLPAVCEWQV